MKSNKLYKNIVLFVLFIVPLLFYIYLQISTHNFVKLPIRNKKVTDISTVDPKVSLKDKVSVVIFLGSNVTSSSAELFNLNEKIYKSFYGYPDYQLVLILPKGTESAIDELKSKKVKFSNTDKMRFVFANGSVINSYYSSFQTGKTLDQFQHTSEAFIIDKNLALRRGETKDKDDLEKLGYNMRSVAELKNEMKDDIKILLAEYRFALKKNGEVRRKI